MDKPATATPVATLLERLNRSLKVIGTEEELQAQGRARHEKLQMDLLETRLGDWGVGKLERQVVLGRAGKLTMTPAMEAARRMLDDPARLTLVLSGPAGDGKTVAAVRWLTRAARRPILTSETGQSWEWDPRTRFAPVFDLERKARSWDPQDKGWMDDLRTCRALVIDDLGAETGDIRGTLTALVYERCRQQLRTVITTNLDPKAFSAKYEDRNVDRLLQAGAIVECGQHNLRRAAGGAR